MPGMRSLWLVLLSLSVVASLCRAASPRVTLVESYHADFEWDVQYRQGLMDRLGGRVRLESLQLDAKHLPAEAVNLRAGQILQTVVLRPPQLLIVGDDAALKLVGAPAAESGVPVVYLGINGNPRAYFHAQPRNVTGVLERPLIQRSVAELSSSVPGLRRALVMLDCDFTSDILRSDSLQGKESLQVGSVAVDVFQACRFADWQRMLAQAPDTYQAVWIGLYQALKDEQGRPIPDKEILAWTSAHARLPLFALWRYAVGKDKAAGGMVISGRDQGIAAGELAEKILFEGRKPGDLYPVTPNTGQFVFSKSSLTRFGISLPERVRRKAEWIE